MNGNLVCGYVLHVTEWEEQPAMTKVENLMTYGGRNEDLCMAVFSLHIQSTLALRTPRYYGHPVITDSS